MKVRRSSRSLSVLIAQRGCWALAILGLGIVFATTPSCVFDLTHSASGKVAKSELRPLLTRVAALFDAGFDDRSVDEIMTACDLLKPGSSIEFKYFGVFREIEEGLDIIVILEPSADFFTIELSTGSGKEVANALQSVIDDYGSPQ